MMVLQLEGGGGRQPNAKWAVASSMGEGTKVKCDLIDVCASSREVMFMYSKAVIAYVVAHWTDRALLSMQIRYALAMDHKITITDI